MKFQEHIFLDLAASFITIIPPRLQPNYVLHTSDILNKKIFFKLEVDHVLLVVLVVKKSFPGDNLSNWVNLSHYSKPKAQNEPFSLILDQCSFNFGQ